MQNRLANDRKAGTSPIRKWSKRLAYFVVSIIFLGVVVTGLYRHGLYVSDVRSSQSIFINGGTIFDGTGRRPFHNEGLLVSDGNIKCLGRHCEPETDDHIALDATGFAIVPGLIDLHVHFVAQSAEIADKSIPSMVWNMAQLRPDIRRKWLESGITSVRSVGDPSEMIVELKQMLESGELLGPRLFAAGPVFTAPGGHPTLAGRDPNAAGVGGEMTFQSNDSEAITEKIAQLHRGGADGIKAVFQKTVDPEDPSSTVMLTTENMETIVREARSRGMWIAVHVGPGDESRVAAELGATSIEHGVRAGNLIEQETIRSLIDKQIVYVPTLGNEAFGAPEHLRTSRSGSPNWRGYRCQ